MHTRTFHSCRAVVGVAMALALCGPGAAAHAATAGEAPMGGHMTMTTLRPMQPGDQARADAIVAAARKFADQYKDYRKALAEGYTIFHPEIKQDVYHFTNETYARQTTLDFNPAHPTSLLYERVAPAKAGEQPGYKLVGVMYTAPYGATLNELNERVPLSIARWHLHTNLCLPPEGGRRDEVGEKGGRFGLLGSITTPAACEQAGGMFLPHIFGWMVHVYPYETDPAKIWAAGMDDKHGMQHDAMAPDMPM